MAQHGDRNALGRLVRLPFLLCPLLERAVGLVQHYSALSRIAVVAAAAHAVVEILARSAWVRVQRHEPANVHSGPCLFSWRLVLFSGTFCFEISTGISSLAPSRGSDCHLLEAPFWRTTQRTTIGDTRRHGNALARYMGLACGLRSRVYAEPAGHQHSSFLDRAGGGDSSARAVAAHVGVAAALELARGTRGKMGDHRARGRFSGHGRVGLSKLFSIPECAQHGAAGLPPGK